MEEKTKKKLRKIDKQLKKDVKINFYGIITLIIIAITLASLSFYFIGSKDGYNQKTSEIKLLETQELEKEMMNLEYSHLKELFLSYIMIKIMFWFKWIVMALLLGWILHGIF